MPSKRHLLFLLVCVTASVIALAYANWLQKSPQITQTATQIPLNSQQSPAIGGKFELKNDKGETVTEQTLNRKYHVLFFGYANCPDICPGMLQTMAGIFDRLPPEKAAKVQMAFISVDPTRDTLDKLGTYVRSFHKSFVGWTGTKQQIDAMTRSYFAYYALDKKDENGDYAVNHSSIIYLLDPQGKMVTHLRNSDSASHIQAELERLIP